MYYFTYLFITDALAWKEAFEKAKKIVGSECEIYAGKNSPIQKHVESDSESSSEVSFDESTDNEEVKSSKQNEKCNAISEQKEVENTPVEKKDIVTNYKIIKEITKLNLKDDEQK